jgi:hypothetical protein
LKWSSNRKPREGHGNNGTKENWYSSTGRGKGREDIGTI